ncbi:MAG: protein kinase [Planctomycetota bacterium]
MGWLNFDDDGCDRWVEIPPRGRLVVGRSRHCDVILAAPEVSRRHVIVQRRRGVDWVADPGTRNGTLLNGEQLVEPQRLSAGDRLTLAGVVINYVAQRPEGSLDGDAADAVAQVAPAVPEVAIAAQELSQQEPSSEVAAGAAPVAAEEPDAELQAAVAAATHARAHQHEVERPSEIADAVTGPAVPPATTPFSNTPRWRDVQLIGRGGMGEVYRAHDRDLGIDVAIKRLRRRGDGSERLLERLHAREAAIGRTIRHDNVVRTLEDGIHDGDPYMLLDWVEGATLEEHLLTRGRSLFDRIELLRQIALGLGAAHAAGVVHADLKPANLLVMEAAPKRQDQNLDILIAPESELDDDPSAVDSELLDEIAKRAHIPEPDFSQPPFVGREGEMHLLEEVVATVPGNGLRWVLIFGERGAGKARLAREFIAAHQTSGTQVTIRETEGWQAPPPGSTGIWLTLLPPLLPDDEQLHRDYEARKIAGEVVELYLKPFLLGQSVRLVERMVHDAEAARQFVEFAQDSTDGNPARLLAALRGAFEAGAWSSVPGGFRFSSAVLIPQEQEVARQLLEDLDADAKGVRDALTTVSALGTCMDFQTLVEATGVDRSSLYYILEHAAKSEYLRRDSHGRYWFTSEPFRLALAKRLDPKVRLKSVRRVLPRLGDLLTAVDPPLPLFAQVAALERELGYPDRAFVCLVRGALQARLRYDRTRFLDLVDAARECYRDCNREGHRQRELLERAGELLGPSGRGLAGLERLRGLPTQVRLKITDFGIARRTGADTAASETPWGTPRYMSPEQAGRKALGTESDVFSFGLLAREVLEESHPLGAKKGRQAIAALVDGGPGGPGPGVDLPDELKELLGRMLVVEARKRPSVEEIARTLQAVQLRLAIQEQR